MSRSARRKVDLTVTHWLLAPKWYVQELGRLRAEGPYAPKPPCDHVTCALCDGALLNEEGEGGHYCRNGGLCLPCGAKVPVSRIKRVLWWPIQTRADRLRWWYCQRFGQRVILR